MAGTYINTFGRQLIFCSTVLFSLPLFSQTTEQRRADSLLLAGIEHIQHDDFDAAENLLLKARNLAPENDAVYYYLGYKAYFSNDAVSAEKNFRQAYQLDSSNVWYCKRLAALYERMGRNEEAEKLYLILRDKFTGDLDVLTSLYDIYFAEGKFDLADSTLTKIERLTGLNEYTELSRIDLYKVRGDYDKFFSSLSGFFAKADVPASGKKDIIERLLKTSNSTFNYYHIKDYNTLVDVCLKTHPGDTLITHLAADWYVSTGKPAELKALIRTYPNDMTLLSGLTTYYIINRQYEAALPFIEKGIELAGDSGEDLKTMLLLHGDCNFQLGRYSATLKDYERLLKMAPDDIYVLNNYSYYLSVVGKKLSTAEKLSRKTIEAQPENPTFLDTYGWILYRQKKYAQAKNYLQKAIVHGGDSAEIYKHYAATLDALGEKALADVYRQKALAKENGK